MQRELLMGARLEAEDAAGCTALHHAVRSGKVDAVEMLLEAGADANARDLEDNRPLHGISNWLDMEPDVEIVVALCRYGADLHAQVSPHQLSQSGRLSSICCLTDPVHRRNP